MNIKRRKKLSQAIVYIEMAKQIVKTVKNEEEFSYDNLPENLQCSIKGCDMEDKVEQMEDIIDKLNNVTELIDDVKF